MSKKKDGNFNKGVMVRFYDTVLADKLSMAYGTEIYESKSSFLTELIEDGLSAREVSQKYRNELDGMSNGIIEKLNAIELRQAEFENTVYTQLKAIRKDNNVSQKLASATYYLLEALNSNSYLLQKELDSGLYDLLPTRFWESA